MSTSNAQAIEYSIEPLVHGHLHSKKARLAIEKTMREGRIKRQKPEAATAAKIPSAIKTQKTKAQAWSPFYYQLANKKGLTLLDVAHFGVLQCLSKTKSYSFATAKARAEILQCGERTVRTSEHRLEKAGLIHTEHTKCGANRITCKKVDGEFVKLEWQLLKGLSLGAAVLLQLSTYKAWQGVCTLKARDFAVLLGCSLPSVNRYTQELKAQGLAVVEGRRNRKMRRTTQEEGEVIRADAKAKELSVQIVHATVRAAITQGVARVADWCTEAARGTNQRVSAHGGFNRRGDTTTPSALFNATAGVPGAGVCTAQALDLRHG